MRNLIWTKVKIKNEVLEWDAKNPGAFIRPGGDTLFNISDSNIMSIMLKSMFPECVESLIIGYGSIDEDASKKFDKTVYYIKVQHFMDGVPFDQEYLSVFDIERPISQ